MATETALKPIPTATITLVGGDVTTTLVVPCEPINEWLAVTPHIDGENGGLYGTFAVTHLPTGLRASGDACIECARAAGRALAALPVDWSTVTRDGFKEWMQALPDGMWNAVYEAAHSVAYCYSMRCWHEESRCDA